MDAPENILCCYPYGQPPIPFRRQDRHFYFFLFLFSRYARNVITKLPKAISKPIIPIKIIMISAAVILTHLPSPHRQAGYVAREATICRGYSMYSCCYTKSILPCLSCTFNNNYIFLLHSQYFIKEKHRDIICPCAFLFVSVVLSQTNAAFLLLFVPC